MKHYILSEIDKDDFVNRMCEIGLGDKACADGEIVQIWNFLNNQTNTKDNTQFSRIINFLKTRLTTA